MLILCDLKAIADGYDRLAELLGDKESVIIEYPVTGRVVRRPKPQADETRDPLDVNSRPEINGLLNEMHRYIEYRRGTDWAPAKTGDEKCDQWHADMDEVVREVQDIVSSIVHANE